MHFRAGRYIEFVQYIFIRDTVWRNTVNIEFVTSASEKIYLLLFVKIAQNIEQIALKFVQMKFLAIHIAKQKIQKFWYIYGRKFTKYLHGTWSLLDILMIFGIKEWHLQCIVGYCYIYTCAAYDWFGAPGSHIITISMNSVWTAFCVPRCLNVLVLYSVCITHNMFMSSILLATLDISVKKNPYWWATVANPF